MSVKDFLLEKGIIVDEITRSVNYRSAREAGWSYEHARAYAVAIAQGVSEDVARWQFFSTEEAARTFAQYYNTAITLGMSEAAASLYASRISGGVETEEAARTSAQAYDTAITLGMSEAAAHKYALGISRGETEEAARTFAQAYDTAITLGMSEKEANTYATAITLGMSQKEAFAYAKGPKFR